MLFLPVASKDKQDVILFRMYSIFDPLAGLISKSVFLLLSFWLSELKVEEEANEEG